MKELIIVPVVKRSTDRNKQLMVRFVRFFFPDKEETFFSKFLYTNTFPFQLNKEGKVFYYNSNLPIRQGWIIAEEPIWGHIE